MTRLLVLGLMVLLYGSTEALAWLSQNFLLILPGAPSSGGSPPSTLSCNITYPTGQTAFVAPVAQGTQVAACTVSAGASLAIDPSSPDASYLAVSGTNIMTAAVLTVARGYTFTVKTNP